MYPTVKQINLNLTCANEDSCTHARNLTVATSPVTCPRGVLTYCPSDYRRLLYSITVSLFNVACWKALQNLLFLAVLLCTHGRPRTTSPTHAFFPTSDSPPPPHTYTFHHTRLLASVSPHAVPKAPALSFVCQHCGAPRAALIHSVEFI